MQQQFLEFGKYYGIAITLFLFFYFLGFLLFIPFSSRQKDNSTIFFLKLFLGSIAVPVLLAILYTEFKSIFVIIPFLYLLTVLLQLKNYKEKLFLKIEGRYLLISIIFLLFFLIIQTYVNHFFDSDVAYLHFGDSGIYTAAAAYLPISGVEVSSPWYQLFNIASDELAKPYHYGDLWQIAFLTEFFTEAPLNLYMYAYIPVLATIIFFGKIAIFKKVAPTPYHTPFLLLLAGLTTLYNTALPEVEWASSFLKNITMQPKVFIVELSLSAICLTLLYRNYFSAAIITCIMPIFNIVLAPVVFSAAFLTALWKFLRSRFQGYLHLWEMILYCLIAAYLIGFYYFFGSFETSSDSIEPKDGGYWYWFIKNFTAIGVKHFIFHAVLYFCIFLLWNRRREISNIIKQFLLFCALLLLSGALATSILNNNFEHFQFHELVFTPVSSIMFLISFSTLLHLTRSSSNKRIIIAVFSFQILYSTIASVFLFEQSELSSSRNFIKETKILLNDKAPLGVFITNQEMENSITADPRICYFCSFLRLINKENWANSLSVPENLDNLKYKERANAVKLSPFYRFIQEMKKQGKYVSYNDAQVQFINTYKVDYLIVEKGADVPIQLLNCVTSVAIDSVNGHQLMILSRPCASSSY